MAKLSKDQAFAAAKSVRTTVIEMQKANATIQANYPPERTPPNIKQEFDRREAELTLLIPALDYLEGIAGRTAPTL